MRANAEQIAYINAQIGKPWADGAMGPDAYNCWGLVRAVYARLFDHALPIVNLSAFDMGTVVRAFRSHPMREQWEVTRRPAHGAIATMRASNDDAHIGIYLGFDRGGLLHSVEQYGVRYDHPVVLPMLGMRRITYWQPRRVSR